MCFFLKYLVTLFYKKLRIKIVVSFLCESGPWTLRTYKRRRLDALEMWISRRIKKIAWIDRKTNLEVLKMQEEEDSIVESIVRRTGTGLIT